MKIVALILVLSSGVVAAEKPVNFIPATPDPLVGDWQGDAGGMVAQVIRTGDNQYQATLLESFDTDSPPVATLHGDAHALSGDGWTATVDASHLACSKGDEHLDLKHVQRKSPTLGATPPAGAVVLFDGKNLDAWAKKAGKDWLKDDGPAPWKLSDGAVEVVPGSDCIITHEKFGDCHVHVEFRTLGAPTNSGVFLQTRYEVNINETYGHPESSANGGLDNCTSKDVKPKARAALPPLAWQAFDIDFHAPRFDASNKKTNSARMTVLLNGVKIHDNQQLDVPHGAASRLGEAPSGPLMLQEHGMPLQFRNIWVVPARDESAASR